MAAKAWVAYALHPSYWVHLPGYQPGPAGKAQWKALSARTNGHAEYAFDARIVFAGGAGVWYDTAAADPRYVTSSSYVGPSPKRPQAPLVVQVAKNGMPVDIYVPWAVSVVLSTHAEPGYFAHRASATPGAKFYESFDEGAWAQLQESHGAWKISDPMEGLPLRTWKQLTTVQAITGWCPFRPTGPDAPISAPMTKIPSSKRYCP